VLAKSKSCGVQALKLDAPIDHSDARHILGKAIVSGAEEIYSGLRKPCASAAAISPNSDPGKYRSPGRPADQRGWQGLSYTYSPKAMTKHSGYDHSLDIYAIARQTMLDAGFVADMPAAVNDEVTAVTRNGAAKPSTPDGRAFRDMRDLLWSSIDDKKSRDLDQVEYAEKLPDRSTRLLVGIADVDALVSQNSAIDKRAATNCTSIYTGVKTFPMLPEELSTDLSSLNPKEDRLAIVTEMVVSAAGVVTSSNIYRAYIRNHAKLAIGTLKLKTRRRPVWLGGLPPRSKIPR